MLEYDERKLITNVNIKYIMTSAILFLIGRLVFGAYWLNASYNHLFKSSGLVGYAQFKGVKSPKTAVIGSGILLLIGGLSMITGDWPRIGIAALFIFLVGVTFKMHAFWKETDPQKKSTEMIGFQKNMALAAALLMMLAITLPWMYSL